jgi:hypothetical protein
VESAHKFPGDDSAMKRRPMPELLKIVVGGCADGIFPQSGTTYVNPKLVLGRNRSVQSDSDQDRLCQDWPGELRTEKLL